VPTLNPQNLHDLISATCRALGSEAREAQLVADQLIGANLAGHDSHGVGMLPAYVFGAVGGKLHINEHPEVITDAGALLVLDGRQGFGQVNGYETMELGIERAREHGAAVIGLRNSFHIGRIGHWGEQCAAAGMVSIHFVNVIGHPPLVAPYGGADAAFSTNPFCASIPGIDGKPAALLDMATSIIAQGKARVAHNKGVKVPDGSVLDAEGRLTDDPGVMFADPRGALVAFGDHKGSGLAIMCELLGAALLGGETAQPENPRDGRIINNMLSIIIDPSATGDLDRFRDEVAKLATHVTSSRLREGSDAVLMPGQPEEIARAARADGFEVDPNTIEELRASAAKAGVDAETINALLT
jgi:hydroxycarboxylate dehydrogenase B